MSESKSKGVPPVFKSKAGSIEGALWEQKGEKGTFLTATLQRSYKDGDEWKKTNSLRINDIPSAKLVLDKMYEYAKMEHKTGSSSEE